MRDGAQSLQPEGDTDSYNNQWAASFENSVPLNRTTTNEMRLFLRMSQLRCWIWQKKQESGSFTACLMGDEFLLKHSPGKY